MRSFAAVLAGAAMLAWPALVNGYPIMFSDTAGLAEMGLALDMGWDKPWVYGPLIYLLNWGVSFWGVVAGQCLLTSAVLWAVGRAAGPGRAWSHLLLCAVLAAGSAAPWFTCLVMPDIFAPLVVLCLFLLGWGSAGRWAVALTVAAAAVGIAAHLAHLIVACGCLVAIAVARWRRLLLATAPLALALAWLFGSNVVGNGVAGISPYGSVFALARLQADGPAADYLRAVCPGAGFRTCAWVAELPMDSDAFLWRPDGPVWGHDYGPILYAPEASRIVASALRYEPALAAEKALLNTWRQLFHVRLGDTLGSLHLRATVGRLLGLFFPAAETARFEASRQMQDRLAAVAAPLEPLRLALLGCGSVLTLVIIPWAWKRQPVLAGLALTIALGILANAFATGALSGPHDRYGARIAWLVLLPPLLAGANAVTRRRVTA